MIPTRLPLRLGQGDARQELDRTRRRYRADSRARRSILRDKVEPGFADRNARVRYTAAAAVIRLSSVADRKEKEKEADKSDGAHFFGQMRPYSGLGAAPPCLN